MASLIPLAMNDARNAALLHTTGADKKAFNKMANKYAKIARNPAKSAWASFKSIFGFGLVPISHRRTQPKKKVGRPKGGTCGCVHQRGKGVGARGGRPQKTKRK